ncbi:MAG: ABC transporter ATP-binding protein [Acidimicrobiales bacterium]
MKPERDSGAGTVLLEIEDIAVTYDGSIHGLERASLEVDAGEVVALVGPNGAGKTTLLRAIAGFLPGEGARIDRGQVRLFGQSLAGKRPWRIAKAGVAFVPERDKVFPGLTVAEHLQLGCRSGGRGDAWKVGLSHFPVLEPHLGRQAGLLSGGQRQMLAIAAALGARPRLLLVDELSQGLSPGIAAELARSVASLKNEGMAVLIVEQNARLASEIADRIGVLEHGILTTIGRADQPEVQRHLDVAYLGVSPSRPAASQTNPSEVAQ